jgi:predicted acetyltransferase
LQEFWPQDHVADLDAATRFSYKQFMVIMPNDSMLVTPSSTHARSYQTAVEEGYAPDPAAPKLDGSPLGLAAHIAWLNAQGDMIRLPDGREVPRLPHTQLWLIHAYTFIGRLNIRFKLTPELQRWGGHIGYAIRPSFQRRGFGTHILAKGIEAAREAGLGGLLLTCLDTNIASIRVIEANGGALLEVGPHPWHADEIARRYWIDPPPA